MINRRKICPQGVRKVKHASYVYAGNKIRRYNPSGDGEIVKALFFDYKSATCAYVLCASRRL